MNTGSTDQKDFIRYPTNRVVGTLDNVDRARAAIDALLSAGFAREQIDILHDEEDLRRFDPPGAEHGFLAQFQRTWIRNYGSVEEFEHLTHYLEDVRAGRFVIMVLATRRLQRMVAADILNRHGAALVAFYGRWAWEDLSAAPPMSPEDIPALFVRAWNDGDPDALASLFDEDAAFVHVTGLCWHDRAAIREAHAHGQEHIFGSSTLATDVTKVKLLRPDVAVVHTRMTQSGPAPAGAATQPGLRTTIVSFVVHRIGERWRCASAHNTDVLPAIETNDLEEPGGFRSAGQPGGRA